VSGTFRCFIMPHPQTWRLSQDASKASGECSVCHAVRQLHLKDGTVHQHGSRNNRCPGSGKPPAVSYPPPQRSTTSTTSSSGTAASPSQPTVIQTQHQTAQQQQLSTLGHPSLSGNIIKHIPRSARPHCAAQLITTIKEVIAQPEDVTMWSRLLNYGEKLLLVPPRSGRKHNIANVVKKRTMDATPTAAVHKPTRPHSTPRSDEGSALTTAVRSKLEDGNIRAGPHHMFRRKAGT